MNFTWAMSCMAEMLVLLVTMVWLRYDAVAPQPKYTSTKPRQL